MKVLWLINNEIPIINSKINFVNEGWIAGMLNAIEELQENEINITILYPQSVKANNVHSKINAICNAIGYYKNKNATKYDKTLKEKFLKILKTEKPDVVHIMGSEYPHTYSMICACEQMNILDSTVISIQGLISKCAENYEIGLPNKIVKSYTIRDIIKGNINKQKRDFHKRGVYEVLAIKKAKNVIGRTDWDRACTLQINKKINYFFNNEVLRNTFYNNEWNYEKCEKQTIFMSQGGYPLKGLHFAIKALSIVKEFYPNVKLKIAGNNNIQKNKLMWTTYSKYINKLIIKYGVKENVEFLGSLNEKTMLDAYLSANIYILTSTLENSSNSLGEAMIVGLPTIASDVGGIKSFIKHEETGYIYPCNEYYMLANYIIKVFDNKECAIDIGKNGRILAQKTFNKNTNANALIEIYKKLNNY